MAYDHQGQELKSFKSFKFGKTAKAKATKKPAAKKGKKMKLKKVLLAIASLSIATLATAQSPFPDNNVVSLLNTGVTNMAASSTNTTSGLAYAVPNVKSGAKIYFSAQTYTNVGTVRAYFATSPDGTTWTPAVASSIILSMGATNSVNAAGVATNVLESSLINLIGISRIRLDRVDNNTPASLTNMFFKLCYPADSDIQNRP